MPQVVPGSVVPGGPVPVGGVRQEARVAKPSCAAAFMCALRREPPARHELHKVAHGDVEVISGFPASARILPGTGPGGMLDEGALARALSQLFGGDASNAGYLLAGVAVGVGFSALCVTLVRADRSRRGKAGEEGEEPRVCCGKRLGGGRQKPEYEPIADLSLPWVSAEPAEAGARVEGPAASPAGEVSV